MMFTREKFFYTLSFRSAEMDTSVTLACPLVSISAVLNLNTLNSSSSKNNDMSSTVFFFSFVLSYGGNVFGHFRPPCGSRRKGLIGDSHRTVLSFGDAT